jgi:hypothetical protein
MLYKRSGLLEQAVAIWEERRRTGDIVSLVELAKYHEHRRRDPVAALLLTYEALSLISLPKRGPGSAAELDRRRKRLESKTAGGNHTLFHIDSYSFGRVCVSGIAYACDLILLPDKVMSPWKRGHGHRLEVSDLTPVLDARPSSLIIGTGNLGLMRVPRDTLSLLEEHGIRVETYRTAKACRRYNQLACEGPVAAALHLAC